MRAVSIIFAAAVALVAVMATGASAHDCLHACKKFTETKVPGCSLEGDGCKCIFEHKYRVSMKDPTTGDSFESGWTSETSAGDDAIFGLFQKDRGCNCHGNNSIPVGTKGCKVNAKICFFFASAAAVGASQSSFQVYAQVVAPAQSQEFSAIAANSTDLEKAAITLYEDISMFNSECSLTTPEAKKTFAEAFSGLAKRD